MIVSQIVKKRQGLTDGTKHGFELLSLNEFLRRAFELTEEVVNVLKSDCDETVFSLKPWCIETIVERTSGNSCICSITSGTEVEEIAAGINRALLQTQQLREKLSLNVIKEKKLAKQPSISAIYSSGQLQAGAQSLKKGTHSQTKFLGQKSLDFVLEKSSCTKTDKTGDPSKYSAKLDTTFPKEKDFLAINKLNVKNMKPIDGRKTAKGKQKTKSKISGTGLEVRSIDFDKRSSAASTSELKNLIQKMSTESTADTTFGNINDSNCPLHGNSVAQFTHKRSVVTMDVVEGLDRFGVPGEIVRTLKTYHTYLEAVFSNEPINYGKREKSVQTFLVEFEGMNKNTQERLVQRTHFIRLSKNLMSLFQNLFSENINSSHVDEIKKRHAELNFLWKKCDAQEFDVKRPDDIQNKVYYFSDPRGWMSNGIWNLSCIRNFKEMSRAHCIRYTNKNQLSSFFQVVQQLQQTLYFKELIDVILRDIVPGLKESFDPTDPEHIKAYKMISVLCQGLNPKIPVLVRTQD